MKTYCEKPIRLSLAKALLFSTALVAAPASSVWADPSDPSATSGNADFFSQQFTFEAGPDGVKINGSPATPGVLYVKGGGATEKVPWLGVATESLDAALAAQLGLGEKDGITVTTTVPDSPAAKAGIGNFDILLEVDGVKLDSPQTLRELIRGKAEGDVAKITLLHKGERKEVEATLAERSRAVAEATDEPMEEPAGKPAPRRRGMDPFEDDFLNDQFFKGFGGFGNFGGLGNMKEIEEHMARIREEMESRFEDMRNADPLGGITPGAASDFMHMENSVMSFSDSDGSVTIKRENGKTHVEARDSDNKIVFEGPADSEEELAKMPEDIRAKVEKFEKSGMNFGDFGLFKREPRAMPLPPVQDKVRRKSEIEKEKEAEKSEGE
jgi:membrane-associated protease RseP (regulator of RpoE activity)